MDPWPAEAAAWAALLALALPVAGSLVVPGRAAVSLLVGWAAGAAVLAITYAAHIQDVERQQGISLPLWPLALFGLTLAGLLAVAARYAYRASVAELPLS